MVFLTKLHTPSGKGYSYRKLDIYDRSQMVIYAMKKGLVDIHETR